MFLRNQISQALRPVAQVRSIHKSAIAFSGHNKWSTIKHDKAKNDAEKNKIANKFANAISVAAKIGGPDPAVNVRLATAIEAARKNNVMKRLIENAIKRGAGLGTDKKQVDQMVYEGMGPGGVAFIVEALTDNKNRAISEVRAAFGKYGGSLSPTLFNFERKGYVVCEKPADLSEDDLFEKVIEIGGDDYEIYPMEPEDLQKDKDGNIVGNTELFEVIVEPTESGNVTTELKKSFTIKEVGLIYVPKPDLEVSVDDAEVQERLDKLRRVLDDIDDVTDVYDNMTRS